MEQIFTDAGWTIGGQWINDSNIKKIVMLYAGDSDVYDQATGEVSGSDTFFTAPSSMYPYDKLNVNDSQFVDVEFFFKIVLGLLK